MSKRLQKWTSVPEDPRDLSHWPSWWIRESLRRLGLRRWRLPRILQNLIFRHLRIQPAQAGCRPRIDLHLRPKAGRVTLYRTDTADGMLYPPLDHRLTGDDYSAAAP